MSIYRILEFYFGEEQCYRHRERGNSWGGTNRTFFHKKHTFAPFSSLSHLWGLSRCHVPVAGTYLPALSVCVAESAWCEHRQRFPGGRGAALEYQFSLPPDACAVLILTPARCQHWFRTHRRICDTNRPVMFLLHRGHRDMAAKSKRVFRGSFKESVWISNEGVGGGQNNSAIHIAPFWMLHTPVPVFVFSKSSRGGRGTWQETLARLNQSNNIFH